MTETMNVAIIVENRPSGVTLGPNKFGPCAWPNRCRLHLNGPPFELGLIWIRVVGLAYPGQRWFGENVLSSLKVRPRGHVFVGWFNLY